MNEDIRGTIFLSHASVDKSFVKRVKEKLDSGVVFYDIDTINPGQDSLNAMRSAVESAAVFVLFHSPKSQTVWVDFERDLAEFEKIRRPQIQILVCPIDDAPYKSLPKWMHRYMTTTPDFRINDIVRAIHHRYEIAIREAKLVGEPIYEGREDLERRIAVDMMTAPAKFGRALNVVLLAGIQGMGRATVARGLIIRVFKGMRPGGPVFDLTDAADAIDWHLKFYEDLNGGITSYEMARQIDAFPSKDADAQAEFLHGSLHHWGCLNQVVTIRSRWGLRDRGHEVKSWALQLFKRLATDVSVKLILISDRKLPLEKLSSLGNVQQYEIGELPDETIEYILGQSIDSKYLRPETLGSVAHKAHGHAATANHVSFLVNGGISLDSLSQFPEPIYAFQDKALEAIYTKNLLTPVQGRIIHLLSWLPRLSSDILAEVFVDVARADLFRQLWQLNEYSLITQSEGGFYRVLAVVSSTFRRFAGKEDRELLGRVAVMLKKRFESGQITMELIDSLLIGLVSIEGGLPEALRKVITPANLLAVVEDQYNLGMRGENPAIKANFQLAYKLSRLALTMDCPDDTLENILFLGADALVRAGEYPTEVMPILLRKGFSSAHYIEGSYLFHTRRDYEGAAKQIELALKSGHFVRRAVRLLARIYLRSGRFDLALNALSRIDETRLLRDTGLVIMKIRALRGLRRYELAHELQSKIGAVDDGYGHLDIYKTGHALRDGDLTLAKKHLANAQSAPRSNKATLKFLECAIAIESRDFSLLPEACALAEAAGREPDALQLRARAAVVSGDWRDAEKYLSGITPKDWFDLNVELRMLELKLQDPEIRRDPAALKDVSLQKEEVLRKSLTTVEGARF